MSSREEQVEGLIKKEERKETETGRNKPRDPAEKFSS